MSDGGGQCHDASSSKITTDYQYVGAITGNPSLTVTVSGDVSLYVLSLVAGMLPQSVLSAQSISEINKAYVSLMLDTSDSMKCDASQSDTPYCGCTNATHTCDDSKTKLNFLKKAAQNFLDYFDPGRDRINLIPYNTGATMEAPHGAPFQDEPDANGHTFDRGEVDPDTNTNTGLKGKINLLTAVGLTNPCDALLQSYMESERLSVLDQTAYVMFSDGAPTAGRFWFAYNANWHGAPTCSSTNWNNQYCLVTSGNRTHTSMKTNDVWQVDRFIAGTPNKEINSTQRISLYDFYNWGYTSTVSSPTTYSVIPSRLIPAPKGRSRDYECGTNTTYNWTPYNFAGPGMPPGVCYDTPTNCIEACPRCSYMAGWEAKPAYGGLGSKAGIWLALFRQLYR